MDTRRLPDWIAKLRESLEPSIGRNPNDLLAHTNPLVQFFSACLLSVLFGVANTF